ncbi:RNA-guided endonuclease InsQ/TnpB family protein [Microseira wollei]|uniref:RNA-guided endonuclease InsQ/TnpB family protein n=1 Tax=Microseira wollei TaxID=467598 RepID=UPI0021F5E295|nr:transposase [Microseira wollei]
MPEAHQSQVIDEWIELSRRQYNFRLGERFRWFDSTRTPVNACPLNVSIVPVEDIYRNIPLSKTLSKGKRKGEEYSLINQGYVDWPNVQKDDLTSTKRLFPEYKEMPSQVLQNVIERVTNAFDRFVKGDGNGKRSGKPKFKGKPYYRSICFPQGVEIVGTGQVDLPKIGVVSFMEHRPIPSGFTVKTATIVKELDGYSISFALDDESVPKEVVEIQPTEQNSKGIDLGLEFFASCSDGTQVEFPRWFRQLEEKMQGLQAKKARTPHGSIGRKILAVRIAWYQRSLARSRKDWQFKLAYKLFEDCQVIFIEDLALKNLIRRNQLKTNSDGKIMPNGQAAKSGLNKSMTDAALGQFVKILEWVAFKLGKRVLKVDPSGTSQYCHACLGQVPKSLKDRWHDCPHCLESLPRDVNSGKLIKWIGLNTVGMDSASLKNALNSAPTRAVTTKQEARVLSVLR